MQEEKDSLVCDVKNRCLIINKNTINMPPGELVFYMFYLKNKTLDCLEQEKETCEDCSACYKSTFDTVNSSLKLYGYYKNILSGHSDQYQRLKQQWKTGFKPPYEKIFQTISKINKKIKIKLKDSAHKFTITNVGAYGTKSYGIKLDKKKIFFIED